MASPENSESCDYRSFTYPTDEEIAQAWAGVTKMLGYDLFERTSAPAPEPSRAEKWKYNATVMGIYAAVGSGLTIVAMGLGALLWDSQPESAYHQDTPAVLPRQPESK